MKNVLTTLLLLFTMVAFAQTKVQLEVENENEKEQYKLKLEREVDGKAVVTEKTYSSKEEMKNDPDLKDIDLHFMEGHSASFSSKDGNVLIEIDKDVKEGDHKTMFISKGGEGDTKIEVTIDEDGTHHVKVNGEEVDYEDWKKDQHSNTMMWTKDGKHIKKEVIIIAKDGEGHEEKMVELIVSNFVLHLEEIDKVDEKAFSLEDSKTLKLDEFNFYPNPSNGTFNLKFEGKERPTMIKVTDINGKEIYAEDLQGFTGSYDKKINLSGLKKGIYLLQVVQGSKAVNKKIVID